MTEVGLGLADQNEFLDLRCLRIPSAKNIDIDKKLREKYGK